MLTLKSKMLPLTIVSFDHLTNYHIPRKIEKNMSKALYQNSILISDDQLRLSSLAGAMDSALDF